MTHAKINWALELHAHLPEHVNPGKWIAARLREVAETMEQDGSLPPNTGYGAAPVEYLGNVIGYHHGDRSEIT